MPSPFAALAAQLSGAVDAHMGEMLRFTPKPKKDSFGAPTAVDSRQSIDVIGTFIEGDQEITFTDGDRRISDFNSRMSQHEAWASVDRALFGSNAPRKGDTIVTVDQPSVRSFEIVDVLPFGHARWAFLLVRA